MCVVLVVLALSRLTPATSWQETGLVPAVLGAGFTAVMVTAAGTGLGDAPPGCGGVVGGLEQTARNVGPTLGVAVAAALMPLTPTAEGSPAHRPSPSRAPPCARWRRSPCSDSFRPGCCPAEPAGSRTRRPSARLVGGRGRPYAARGSRPVDEEQRWTSA
ncbi:hypothetical protein [Streptomyces sp. NPDC088864]|uniref:hypothetical protein n=1 Tax=Streptomyces sp. NPDC088864 TaxID=3365910 RepID=UPI00380D0494